MEEEREGDAKRPRLAKSNAIVALSSTGNDNAAGSFESGFTASEKARPAYVYTAFVLQFNEPAEEEQGQFISQICSELGCHRRFVKTIFNRIRDGKSEQDL